MVKKIGLVGVVAIISLVLVAATAWAVGGMGTPARTSSGESAVRIEPENIDETFYVVAYHWGWAAFTGDGTELDSIRVSEGTNVEIYAVNSIAQAAIDKLPAPVGEAIALKGITAASTGIAGAQAAEEYPLWPEMEDHGFIIEWYGVVEYLDDQAQNPVRVAFAADRPGEYEFVCTNYCGPGHTFMTRNMFFVE